LRRPADHEHFAIFIMTAFVANVVIRDDETGFGPIVHSTRVSRFDYLFGRFTGAFLGLPMFSRALGMLLGRDAVARSTPSDVPPETTLGLRILCVPTLFVRALLLCARTPRSMTWTYVGVMVLMLYLVAGVFRAAWVRERRRC
jgi:hypothetical protein